MNTLAVYLISIILLIGVSIVVLRVPVRRDYLHNGRLTIGTAILQASIFFAFGGLPTIYLPADWPASQVTLLMRFIGLVSLSIGLVIMFTGIYQLGILRSLGLQSGVLKESSHYRFSRNPQVLGCVMYGIGFVILWPSWFAVGWGLSLILVLHIMVLTEEEHLHNAYGQDFEQYCKRIHRYLGYPRKG